MRPEPENAAYDWLVERSGDGKAPWVLVDVDMLRSMVLDLAGSVSRWNPQDAFGLPGVAHD